jgi:TatD DNase family protein
MLFDTHAHLNDPVFLPDFKDVLTRAQEAGVRLLLDVGFSRQTITRSKEISSQNSWIYSAFGFHPHEAEKISNEDFDWLKNQLEDSRAVAIGEIGLDFVKSYAPVEIQREVFRKQLEIGADLKKPVILHSRGAEQEVLGICKLLGVKKAVFHCFTGSEETAKQIIDAGYFISFAGFVTFPKGLTEYVASLPTERIFIETDCPYLAPVPKRGKRNEPANVKIICDKLAQIFKMDTGELAKITFDNAVNFFEVKDI